MARVLVTGATGLVGSHVTRLLVERGDDVRAGVRERSRRDNLAGLDVDAVRCDVLDRRQVRRAMKDVELLFHCAGTTSLRMPVDRVFELNVTGTRTVMAEALRAGVARVVHTSSMAAIGPSERHTTSDETALFRAGRYGLPFVNAKHEAEGEVLRACAAGLPAVIVNPTLVFGEGDLYRSSTEVVRRFLRREIPAYVDGATNVVDAQDVAAGHVLAAERGRVGERYLLGNRNFTLDRLFADLGRISGVEPPSVKLPLAAGLAVAAALEALPGRPPVTQTELRASSLWWAFRSTKAKRELGWVPSHHEETLERTVAWYRDREPLRVRPAGTRQPFGLRVAGTVIDGAGGVVRRLGG